MLKSEMQHQFWITKKTVQRKFGSKEDKFIISSDSQLDAKVDIYKSISASSVELSKIIELYQERLCILSQEEGVFGRFLKEAGKRSKTTGQTITNVGKAVSYCGQQRMGSRVPLLRLQHEVDVFRCRAITDMQNTIGSMEKERTEYRAALEWMKSASSELDPDTGRGLEKFRTAQTHVRNAKQLFDNLTMDSIQKIDLLAAARCNMFSHVLVSYMSELKDFAQKTNNTFEAISKILDQTPKYDFCILKDLTQHEVDGNAENCTTQWFDKDQSIFFAKDYMDNKCDLSDIKPTESSFKPTEAKLLQPNNSAGNIMDFYTRNQCESKKDESMEESAEILSRSLNLNFLDSPVLTPVLTNKSCEKNGAGLKIKKGEREETLEYCKFVKHETKTPRRVKTNQWDGLFADLDPLANIEAFDLKLNSDKNYQHI